MASFFSVLGGSLRGHSATASGLAAKRCPRLNPVGRLIGALTTLHALQGGVADIGLQPVPDLGLQPVAPQQSTRASYTKAPFRSIAAEALSFKEKSQHEYSRDGKRYWQVAFLMRKHGPLMPSDFKQKQRQLRAALREVRANPSIGINQSGRKPRIENGAGVERLLEVARNDRRRRKKNRKGAPMPRARCRGLGLVRGQT